MRRAASISLVLTLSLLGTSAAHRAPHLSRSRFSAKGDNDSVLQIPAAGRYAIEVKSEQGVALELVDRMRGIVATAGTPGKKDGRIDRFLDAGAYLVRLHADAHGSGRAILSASAFARRKSGRAPVLRSPSTLDDVLHDHQRLTYWIDLDQRTPIFVEAAGRDLADLRVWEDGTVLVDAKPRIAEIDPVVGEPLTDCQLAVTLGPGHYLVTAYGGPAKKWASGGKAHPFHLRYGFRELPATAIVRARVSPFGADRYLLPATASGFSLRLAKPGTAMLRAGAFRPGQWPHDRYTAERRLTKKNREPEIYLSATGSGHQMVTVRATAGTPYTLLALGTADDLGFRVKHSGSHLVETLETPDPGDTIDATGLVTESRTGGTVVVAGDVIELRDGWSRRMNLLQRSSIVVHVDEASIVTLTASGTELRYRMLRLLQPSYPYRRRRVPPFEVPGTPVSVERGYYRLELEPIQKGIVTVTLSRQDVSQSVPQSPGHGGIFIPAASLEAPVPGHGHYYSVVTGNRPGAHRGLVVRRLPLDLDDAVPVTLEPGRSVSLPIRASGRRRVVTEPGVSVTIDGHGCGVPCRVGTGDHTIALRLDAARPRQVMVGTEKEARFAPLAMRRVPAPDAALSEPVITDRTPRFFDLAAEGVTRFRLEVSKPGFYVVETTGLLATRCLVRTRAVPAMFDDTSGGPGRNCRVARYLRAGEYLVEVHTIGRSAGHAGLVLSHTAIVDGGSLLLGRSARSRVPSGDGLRYAIHLAAAGRYRVRTLGDGRGFNARLVDHDGWPVTTVDRAADMTLDLPAGHYRYLTEPVDVASKRLTRVEVVEGPHSAQGRGPHPIALGEVLGAMWRDGPGEDTFTFTLPARAPVRITLDNDELEGRVVAAGAAKDATPVGIVAPGRGFEGTLDRGAYVLRVRCLRKDDLLAYVVQVSTDTLVAGTRRTITPPATLDVSLGAEGLVELGSFGGTDVRAELLAAKSDRVIAANDDAEDDWNFRITRRLAAGSYRLRVLPVAGGSGEVTVSMTVPPVKTHAPISTSASVAIDLGKGLVMVPLSGRAKGVLEVRAKSASVLGVAVERGDVASPEVLSQGTGRDVDLALPGAAATGARLRIFSADHAGGRVRLVVRDLAVHAVRLSGRGARVRRPGRRAIAVRVGAAGTFRVRPGRGLRVSSDAGRPLSASDAGDLSLPAGTTWLLFSRAPRDLRIERTVLGRTPAGTTLPKDGRRLLDVDPGSGLLLARIESDGGQPAGAFEGEETFAMALSPHAALAAIGAARHPRLALWNARTGVGDEPVTVTRYAFGARRTETLPLGASRLRVPAHGWRHFDLPPGRNEIHLALGRGLAAVVSDGARITTVVDASTADAGRVVVTRAGSLALADLGGAGGEASVVILSGAPTAPWLSVGQPFDRRFGAPGRLRVSLPDALPAHAVLRLAGEVHAEWIDPAGHLHRGRRLELEGGGRLVLVHGAGVVHAWIEGPVHPNLDRFGPLPEVWPTRAAPGTVVPLGGSAVWIEVALSHDAALSVDAGNGALVAMSRAVPAGHQRSVARRLDALSGDPLLAVAPGRVVRLVPAGHYLVGLRAMDGTSLDGRARITATVPAVLGGGVGTRTLIASGETRTFTFTVAKKTKIGVGVSSDADRLDAVLMDGAGRRVADGRQALVDLAPGHYLLVVRCPDGAGPVRFAPVVLGLRPPGEGPPPEKLADFLTSLGVTRTAAHSAQ